MDIYCPRCGEPCDMDELHDAYEGDRKLSFDEARRVFFGKGCGVLFNGKPCEQRDTFRGEASAVLHEVLGDDVDGIAAMLEDLGL